MAGERTLQVAQDSTTLRRDTSPRALDDVWPGDMEATRADLDRERGLNSDDEDYVEQRPRQRRENGSAAGTSSNFAAASQGPTQELNASTVFSSTTQTFTPSTTPRRLAVNPGIRQHSIPVPSTPAAPTLSQVQSLLPEIPPEVLQLLRRQSTTPSLTPQTQALSLVGHQRPISSTSADGAPQLEVHPSDATHEQATVTPSSKRAACDEDDTAYRRKAKKAKYNVSRPAHSHYRDDQRLSCILRCAATMLQVHFSTVNPFPSPRDLDIVVAQKFTAAVVEQGIPASTYVMTVEHAKLLGKEESNIRSHIKQAIMAGLVDKYRLHGTPRNASEKEANKARVAFLLHGKYANTAPLDPRRGTDCRFHCLDPETARGRFRHPIISYVIDKVWFLHRNSLGPLYASDFKPIPHAIIANICTGVRECLTLYETGERVNGQFAKSAWKEFDDYFLYTQGLSHARAKADAQPHQPVIQALLPAEVQDEMTNIRADLGDFQDSSDVEPDPEAMTVPSRSLSPHT
ncbi:uncharacterized protein B0H18DRAFT_1127163 [Fomitopsis serialis]|uniref:uncharacterized protein n=1 Tax=Fomitopsis serialis TaxID=139415 RepID=UPI0020087F45|nr:uncharacterized protein B0H18DRAFT_1127163 [Neoantrodia serialis]KAH9912445.1 hypothetical protein B0H18DRAFT_1127163 [Neoantrodia serialis]